MFRKRFETEGDVLVRQRVVTALLDANESVMVSDQGEIQSRGQAASAAATISAHAGLHPAFSLYVALQQIPARTHYSYG